MTLVPPVLPWVPRALPVPSRVPLALPVPSPIPNSTDQASTTQTKILRLQPRYRELETIEDSAKAVFEKMWSFGLVGSTYSRLENVFRGHKSA